MALLIQIPADTSIPLLRTSQCKTQIHNRKNTGKLFQKQRKWSLKINK